LPEIYVHKLYKVSVLKAFSIKIAEKREAIE